MCSRGAADRVSGRGDPLSARDDPHAHAAGEGASDAKAGRAAVSGGVGVGGSYRSHRSQKSHGTYRTYETYGEMVPRESLPGNQRNYGVAGFTNCAGSTVGLISTLFTVSSAAFSLPRLTVDADGRLRLPHFFQAV